MISVEDTIYDDRPGSFDDSSEIAISVKEMIGKDSTGQLYTTSDRTRKSME
jgi:hypothetical protein